MNGESAACGELAALLQELGGELDRYLRFEHPDALHNATEWRAALQRELPQTGLGAREVMREMSRYVIPNGSQIPNPACTSFITTGAASVGVLALLAGAVAAPQRFGLTAFNLLEEVSLEWLAEMFELPGKMKGVYSSGGSVGNLVALGAARQWAFERDGLDPARDGVTRSARIYASSASHHTIHRAAAVLGLGRSAVIPIAIDACGRMCPDHLQKVLQQDAAQGRLPIAVVATAGTTSAGAIDPLREIGELAHRHGAWFHVDGAYGLPGILDPRVRQSYDGLALADSVVVDPHKWLGAPVGIGATFVRDRAILQRAFTQGAADYFEGACMEQGAQHSMDAVGIPYGDFGVELSAPSRGAIVWALIREIGVAGMRERVCRHNAMARWVAERVEAHPNLQLLQQPTLSICCFRFVAHDGRDLNELNRRIHREMMRRGRSMPSTAMINGNLAIRPCFVGARASWEHAAALVEEVLAIGDCIVDRHPSVDHIVDTQLSAAARS